MSEAAESSANMKDMQHQLDDLIARATALYGVKDYSPAAELYSEATELQAQINGEMNVENADLFFAYGRCLFYVAQRTSTVLGGTAAQTQLSKDSEKTSTKKRTSNGVRKEERGDKASASTQDVTPSGSAANVTPTSDTQTARASSPQTTNNKPLFQITGDENWDDSDDDEEGEEQDEEADEEEDDFATSFELLDFARVLYLRKLDSTQQSKAEEIDKGKYVASIDQDASVRSVKARIADIHDLQAEISLEGEKFPAAVSDLKSCLALREELEAPQSALLAECHYKLSLALEAAAQEQQRDANGNPVGEATTNWDVRNEAIAQQEKAIDCCKLRVKLETQAMEAVSEDSGRDKMMAQIEDVQGMIGEMEDRLADLRRPPISVQVEAQNDANKELMVGIMGQIMGADGSRSKEEQKEQLAKVMATATDLSGMVKRKKVKADTGSTAVSTPGGDETGSNAGETVGSKGKRKVQFEDEIDTGHGHGNGNGKRAKVEDSVDSGT